MKINILIWISAAFIISTAKAQVNIDTASFYSVFEQINFENKNIVVIGETHNFKNTYITQSLIIENFAKKGFNTIYIEGGKSEATLINMYFETADTALLQHTRAREKSGAYMEFIQTLYKMNNENKFRLNFIGFDFERPSSVGFLFSIWFANIKIDSIDFDSLSNYLLSLDHECKVLEDAIVRCEKLQIVFDSLKTSIIENEERYKEILNTNFQIFKQIVYNPVSPNYKTRDDNFTISVLERGEDSLSNSIIIAGRNHVMLKGRFIPVLIDSLPEHLFISFLFIYKNCALLSKPNIKTDSRKYMLKYLSRKENKPVILFAKSRKRIIESRRKNIITIVTEFYNQ